MKFFGKSLAQGVELWIYKTKNGKIWPYSHSFSFYSTLKAGPLNGDCNH